MAPLRSLIRAFVTASARDVSASADETNRLLQPFGVAIKLKTSTIRRRFEVTYQRRKRI
jgi:hypothetical protein